MTTKVFETFGGGQAMFATHKITYAEYIAWLRSWYGRAHGGGGVPTGLPEIGNLGKAASSTVTPEGHESALRFVAKLRQMVGDENAEVLSVPCDMRDGVFCGTVYFCWKSAVEESRGGHAHYEANKDEIGTLAIYRV